MSKELRAFRKICRSLSSSYEFTDEYKKNKKLIETALKEKEQQDSVIKILKGVIAFAEKLPDIEIDDDGNFQGIIGAVGMRIQRQMENKERELLRQWVLDTCFPKELKTLEIIKKLFKGHFEIDYDENHDFYEIWISTEYEDIVIASGQGKEEFDLLKEVLL